MQVFSTGTDVIWVTLNVPSAANCRGISRCLESGHPGCFDLFWYCTLSLLYWVCCVLLWLDDRTAMNSVQRLAHLLQQLHDGPAPALVAYLEVSSSYNMQGVFPKKLPWIFGDGWTGNFFTSDVLPGAQPAVSKHWRSPLPPFGHIWDVMLIWRKGTINRTVSVVQ